MITSRVLDATSGTHQACSSPPARPRESPSSTGMCVRTNVNNTRRENVPTAIAREEEERGVETTAKIHKARHRGNCYLRANMRDMLMAPSLNSVASIPTRCTILKLVRW